MEEGGRGLWEWVKVKVDLAQYEPEAIPEVEVRQLSGRDGEYHYLKNCKDKTYYRLSDRDHFLWRLMDGKQTVKDLVVAYFLQFGSFAFARVATLVQGLRTNLFLTDRPVYVYRQVRHQLLRRRRSFRLIQLLSAFFEKQFAVSGLDRWLIQIYRWGGRVFYTWPLLVIYVVVSIIGLYLFYQVYTAGTYGFVTVAGSTGLGLITLTVKHYRREVRRGGFHIYMGMPGFFVDTTDIWMAGKRPALAVSWAGPYSGLILGGVASIVMTLRPDFSLNPILYQAAVVAYLTVFFNLNPLLELDGYYLLMDGLEIPMLRRKSIEFVRTGLLAKLRAVQQTGTSWRRAFASFSREEKIFSAFGLLSAAWTAYAVLAAANLWQSRLAFAVRNLWEQGGDLAKRLASLALVLISLPFVMAIGLKLTALAREALALAARRGLFDNSWKVAAILLPVVAALTMAPSYLGHPLVRPLLSLTALAVAVYFAWRGTVVYAGSRFAPVFGALGLFLAGLLLSEAGATAVYRRVLSADLTSPFVIAFRHLAYLCLLVAGLSLAAGTKLKKLFWFEKALLALGLVASAGLALWIVRTDPFSLSSAGALLDVTGSLLPLLALTFMVPTLFSFLRTGFGPAWLVLALALGGQMSVALLGRYPLLTYQLLATSFVLHHVARVQLTSPRGQPEAALDLSDQHRLQRGFAWTVAGVFGQFREVGGDRQARVLAEQFNNYALAAGWRVSIVQGQVDDSLSADLNLIQRGETYAAALTLLLDLIAGEVGEKLTVRALQRAYDGLPWEEREIGAQYLFRDVARAEALSREFQATRHDYRGLLRRMPLFATMDEEEINLLLSPLKAEHYSPGQVIIRQGDKGDKFYIIAQGHLEVTQRDERGVSEVVNQLDRGDYFGELALLRDAPRNATCRATVPTKVLSLMRDDFDRLVKARFALREKVDRSIAWADLLRRMPLFAELDAQQIQLIAAQLREETYEPGAVIMRQGEIGETFCVIESGRVQVSVTQDGGKKVVAERGPGEYVGEIALLLEVPRTATITALSPVRLLTLHKSDFDRLVVKHLYVSRSLERETSRRMIDLRRVAEVA
ncbi:MAG: hypothetical protein AMJ93_12565 [Anaerolineae bacterium SM23_84]|nr:MAG: hypothetical protein AMJ93_12565 [Anaerolineae bacterium SM23_84]